MKKMTILIPKRLIYSMLIGFAFAIIILVIIHSFGDFYIDKISGAEWVSTSVPSSWWALDCPLGEHHKFSGDATHAEFGSNEITWVKIMFYITASFDGHYLFIFSVGILLGMLIYFSNRLNIRIVNSKA
jgi:hypothetical protein